jgi:hypothetical protein
MRLFGNFIRSEKIHWSNGVMWILDFRILILDLRKNWPDRQLASNVFNPQSKIRNPKYT